MADNFTLRFQDTGSGAPVLLIHGFPFSGAMWARQRQGFGDSTRLIAPDLPGFGNSPIVDASYTVERYAEDCLALLDSLGLKEPVALGGLSMGG
jgi:pimeloyl-ACP methyl ester carboxylesterase